LFANANHKAGCDWNTSKKVAGLLNIPFRNQSLASLSHEFFVRHYHPKGKKQLRVNIAQSKKEKILAEQCHQCNACAFAVEKGQWECDHIVPISCGGDAIARSNLQILCSACHAEKSRKEAAELVANIDNSASYYNDQTLKIFGQRPILGVAHNFMKPEEYTKDVKAGRKILAGLDNNKCYTNLLLTNKHEWNSFSVLNDATPFEKEVHMVDGKFQRGFYYVETKCVLIQGNSWLSVPALEYFLKEKLIKLEQVKACVLSSLGLPANYFARFVTGVQKAIEDASIWKRMINSLVGIMGTRKAYNRNFKILLNKEAAANYINEKRQPNQSITITPHMLEEEQSEKHWTKDGRMKKPDYYEVMFNTERIKEESHFPIYAQVIQQGIVELHKAQRLLEKHGGKLVHMKIDQTVALFDNQEQVDAMWEEARQICWDEEGEIPKYKRADDIHNTELEMHLNEERFECKIPEYKCKLDPGHNDFKSLAAELIDYNKSFQLDAVAGCGKTTLLREIIKELNRRELNWLAMTPTHKSAKVLWRDRANPKKSAQTIHKELGRLKYEGCGGFTQFQQYKWIMVDEKSMIKENFFLLLTKIKRYCPDTRFILSGDWKQLPPVMDRCATFNYKDSYAIWDLCDGRKLKLKKCRRTDEKQLFYFYTHVHEVNVEEFPHEEHLRNICYYNSTRKQLNRYWMLKEARKHKQRMLLKAHYVVKQSQDIILYKDLPVIAMCTRGQYGFSNAEEFRVQEFNSNTVTLRFENDNADDEVEEIKVPTRDFTQFFAPAYAISCHRMQGSSISEKFTIWDWEQMDETLKYVALSRSRKLEYINICSTKQFEAIKEKNAK
ncbi:MAG: AAA family ATPase, partial [Anaerolineaceae bacterium]|nr:AAA family ATPase [Anaerolineaceae bacterium]